MAKSPYNEADFDVKALHVLEQANKAAALFGHKRKGTEHLLLVFTSLRAQDLPAAFQQLNVSYDQVKDAITKTTEQGKLRSPHERPFSSNAKKVITTARNFAVNRALGKVTCEHLLLALLGERSYHAAAILQRFNVDPTAVHDRILSDISLRSMERAAIAARAVAQELQIAHSTSFQPAERDRLKQLADDAVILASIVKAEFENMKQL